MSATPSVIILIRGFIVLPTSSKMHSSETKKTSPYLSAFQCALKVTLNPASYFPFVADIFLTELPFQVSLLFYDSNVIQKQCGGDKTNENP